VTQDSVYDEWYSDIGADCTDNVWVVWDRQGEGTDQFRVYAAHRDSTVWSAEHRLDSTAAYYDGSPDVCLDTTGAPWAAWDGITYSAGSFDIYWNRLEYVSPVQESPEQKQHRLPPALCAVPMPGHGARFFFRVPAPGPVDLAIYDRSGRKVWAARITHAPAGQYE
jgi:hypothetical protein